MDHPPEEVELPRAEFQLAEWLVQPTLNRLSSGQRVVQIEPKQMDVLVFLAGNPGEVVSKQQIIDAVWPDLFITESVISRAIAGLRRALDDDARQPRFIETILKRGYRLIGQVSAPVTGTGAASPTAPPDMAAGQVVPFVVGQWVRGNSFYGRRAQITEVLDGNRNWIWLLGTRRIGKTSLLKQLEHLAGASPERGFFPVFWDLQGADRQEDLHQDFGEVLLDAEERLHGAGIRAEELQSGDLFESLGRLRRALHRVGLRLLLLCDEVEELIHLDREDPALLRKLRRALHSREGVRSVLASSNRLWQLAEARGDTSPFLDGFTPPLYIGALADDEARDLISQNLLPSGDRPEFGPEQVERISYCCGNHPYLIQLLCRRAIESGDLEGAIEEVSADRSVNFFFAVDFELLSDTDREVLLCLAERSSLSREELLRRLPEHASAIPGSLATLCQTGFVREQEQGALVLGNQFLSRWLRDRGDSP
jgi:DNA-binding winged helix-turn-helix (wHTH) protein